MMERPTHLHELIGLERTWTGERTCRGETEVTPFLYNLNGAMHGGVIAYIADTVMGSLVHRFLPKERMSVTSEIKINYMRPATEGKLITLAEILHLGKRTAVAECKMYDEDQNLVGCSTASFIILDRKQA